MNSYIDPYVYLRAASGQDTTTVIGNLTRIASPGVVVGATTIPLITPLTVALNEYDVFTVFDGASTEQVTMAAIAPIGSTSLQTSATQYAHSAGVALASDGTQGSLAEMIINASAQIDSYCRQSLLQATYTDTLPLRTTLAAVTRDASLLLRPKHSPVTAVTAITAQLADSVVVPLSITPLQIDSNAQLVTLSTLTPMSGGAASLWSVVSPPLSQTTPGMIQLSYTAGYTPTALPRDISQACIWLTSDILSDRQNPTGAAEIRLGQMQLVTRLRGEISGDSVLVIRAKNALNPYKQKPF